MPAVGLDTLPPELVAVTTANAVAAVVRFAILRTWVFRPQFGTHPVVRPPERPLDHDPSIRSGERRSD